MLEYVSYINVIYMKNALFFVSLFLFQTLVINYSRSIKFFFDFFVYFKFFMDTSSKLRNFSKCQLKFYRCSLVVAVNKLLDGKGRGWYLFTDNPSFLFISQTRHLFSGCPSGSDTSISHAWHFLSLSFSLSLTPPPLSPVLSLNVFFLISF